MDFQALPKVELHLHLDCSISYAAASQINPQLTRAEYRQNFIAPSKCTHLADFLTRAPQGINLMQAESELFVVVNDLFEQLAADSVIYAEIRFAPLQHLQKGLSAREVVAIVAEATGKAIRDYGIEARLILCTLRHFSEEQSLHTVQLVERFKGTTVAGFDIAADEAGYPIDAHIAAFRYAYDRRIPCTAHAGEARGADSIWETLEHLRPSRIGHGVRSMEDARLIDHLVNTGVHLEICPSSNIQIDVFARYEDHVVDDLYRSGVPLSISTDARTITHITLGEEYDKLHKTFGWTKEHFLRCNLAAVNAAFLPDTLKEPLRRRLKGAYQNR